MPESPLDIFNRLGRKKGLVQAKPYKPPVAPIQRRHPQVVTARAQTARIGNRGSRGGGGSTGFSTSPKRQQTAFDRVMDQITTDFMETAQKQVITSRVADPEEGGDPGIFKKVMGGLLNSPVGTALDYATRPIQAVSESMQSMAEASRPGQPWMQNPNYYLKEGIPGFWRGLMGQSDAGPGDVYEATKNNPYSFSVAGENPLAMLEEAHPAVEQGLAIGTGLVGELAIDPLNVVALGIPSVFRKGGGALTREGLEQTVKGASREAINNAASARPSLFNRSPWSLDMLAGRADSAMDDALNATLLNVAGGGAPHARTLGGAAFPSVVAEKWAQSVIDSISGHADEMYQRILNDAGSLTPADIIARRQASPDFTELWDELTTELMQHYPISGNVDEVLAIIKGNVSPRSIAGRTLRESWEKIRNAHFVELQPHIDEVYKAVENPTTRTLGIRIGGRKAGSKVIPIPVVGRAYAAVGDQIAKIPGIKDIGSFLYEKRFPGLFANKISRASAYGVRGLDNFMLELEKVAKGFKPAEAQDLFKALGDSSFSFGDKRMDDALDWLRVKRDERFTEELREGARSIDSVDKNGIITQLTHKEYDPNYQFLHLKGGTGGARKKFMKGRKNQWATYHNYVGYGIEDAKRLNLRPVDSAFEAMQLHYMDSANKITNSYLWHDLAANYGIMNNATTTGISDLEKAARGLKEVEYSKLSAAFKQMVKDTNGKFYIPEAMHDMGTAFDEMMDWSTAKLGRFGRSYSKVINGFKLWTTLPYPGFHVRNFMGDTMMGMLDGVPPTRYSEVMKKYAASRAGRAANFEIIPGVTLTFKQFMRQFRDEANSSYLKADIGLTRTKTAGKVGGIGRTVGKKVRDFSDDRELLPRFTHYSTALLDEARALWNSGMRDTDKIIAQAKDAALWRVNHYKFDYNALLPWERKLKAAAFPFYTYIRKAIPTLAEQMFINPHYFQMTNRWMQDNDGSAADAFNYMNVPQFWRDFGYGMMTDESEPLGLTGEIFPTNVMDILSSNSLKEAAGDIMSTANPFFQALPELRSGRRMFDDREIEGGIFDYAMSKVPLVGDLQERFSNLPLVPGESPYPITGDNPWSWDKFLSDRLGLGFPLRRATEGQQAQQAETNFDITVDDPLTEYNHSQDRFTIQLSKEEGIFVISDKYTGAPVSGAPAFSTPQEAIEYALTNLPMREHEMPVQVNQPASQEELTRLLASQ